MREVRALPSSKWVAGVEGVSGVLAVIV